MLVGRIRQFRPYLRFSSFDVSTDEGRSQERHRRVLWTGLASAISRGTSITTSLVSIPLTLHYLGTERYGMWMTMSAFTAMLTFADLGIGNGLLTAVSRASGRDQLDVIRAYVSSAFVLLGTIALIGMVALTIAYAHVEWWRIFNVATPLARSEAGPAIAIFLVCFALSLPLGIVHRVQFGLQMGFMASVWQCIGSIGGLCCVLLAIYFHAGLPWLVLAFSGEPVMVALVNSLVFFGRLRPEFAPRRAAASRRHGLELAQIGAFFFVLQAVVAVAFTSDNLVIAQKLGAAQVAQYAVPDRLFAMVSMIVGLAVAPLWPAFGEALARGDKVWARRTLIRATRLSAMLAGAIGLVFVLAAPTILRLWVGTTITPSFFLLLGFAVWRWIEAGMGAASMYLNGLRAVRFQATIAILTALATISLKLLLVSAYGIVIMPWITIGVYVLVTLIPVFFFLRKRA